jgi:predicted Abi (CAAX) family protease
MASEEIKISPKQDKFYSTQMRWIYLLSGWLFLFLVPAHAGHSPPKIVLQIFVQTSGEGLSTSQATSIAIPPNNEIIQIRSLPEITERNLVDAQADASGAIHLRFDHIGQVVLSTFTAQNQNRIMVIMLNGYIIYAPIIDEQITSGELIIPHPIKPEALQLLQKTAQKNVQKAART